MFNVFPYQLDGSFAFKNNCKKGLDSHILKLY